MEQYQRSSLHVCCTLFHVAYLSALLCVDPYASFSYICQTMQEFLVVPCINKGSTVASIYMLTSLRYVDPNESQKQSLDPFTERSKAYEDFQRFFSFLSCFKLGLEGIGSLQTESALVDHEQVAENNNSLVQALVLMLPMQAYLLIF